ncbi:MAG: pirin family protein [Verrucomicrobiia bacterium]
MIAIRRDGERGRTEIDWLDSRHTFSFGEYYDPQHMGFRALRVINDDRVAPGGGFGTHPHRDMEIITVVLDGALEHRDSLGTGSVIRPGDVQLMSAGAGIRHSEFNHSQEEPVHFLQIWVLPERNGLKPGYEQKSFTLKETSGGWHTVVAPQSKNGALTIHQDVSLSVATLSRGEQATYGLKPGRYAWVHVATGGVALNGYPLRAGDGAAVSDETKLTVKATEPSELLLFDLA